MKMVTSRAARKSPVGRATRHVAIHDISVAFFHTVLGEGVWAKPPGELSCEGWLWWVVRALYGMRESSKAFQDLVRTMFQDWAWMLIKTVPCLAYNPIMDSLCGFHGDDFYSEGEPHHLNQVDRMIEQTFKAKKLSRVGPSAAEQDWCCAGC